MLVSLAYVRLLQQCQIRHIASLEKAVLYPEKWGVRRAAVGVQSKHATHPIFRILPGSGSAATKSQRFFLTR